LAARILAVVDTYDAMTSTRPYRQALSHEAAMAEIQRCAGSQLDPQVVQAFVQLSQRVALLTGNWRETTAFPESLSIEGMKTSLITGSVVQSSVDAR
ncbi:MAG: hypothetical protein OWS74_01215, partial [Firmicutes bacterium]|nr:hypothetical protein [Bacillota bacterium]